MAKLMPAEQCSDEQIRRDADKSSIKLAQTQRVCMDVRYI